MEGFLIGALVGALTYVSLIAFNIRYERDAARAQLHAEMKSKPIVKDKVRTFDNRTGVVLSWDSNDIYTVSMDYTLEVERFGSGALTVIQ